ncbi:MAG: discoidin domain-containing protein [Bacteroidaceae bacterium]|nr:discoidin domain-containing protein [Bacteroidaceae bacterium]
MKQFMIRSLMLLSVLLSSLGISDAWAQLTTLEQGSVYRFTNVGREGQALAATNPTSVAGVATNQSSKAQLWYVEKENNGHYALRNLGYGTYLQANGQSSHWSLATTTDAENSWIQLSTVGSNNVFKGYTYGDYGFAHIDNSSNIVGWTTGATSTQWNISKIEMSDTDIQAALSVFNNVATYQTHLDAIFTDKSCTTLMASYDESDVNALPETLQNMVRKVAGTTSWEENYNNGKPAWDAKYAKKYRVQLYEPYNEPECAASALGLNAHTNLNNPTGIFANNGDVLYVMVEDKIKTGSSLYLSYYTGHGKLGGYKNGFELKQGLNVIPVYSNGTNFCINYVVHTFDTSDDKKGNKAKARKLSEYDPIKIHIEGGYINGYYNKMGDALYPADKNADWEYIEARATQTDVTVLGKYMTLQFPLLDKDAEDNGGGQNKGLASYFNELVNVEDCINEWDNVMLWERLLLGVLSESTIQEEAKTSPYAIDNTKKVFEYTGKDGDFESDYSDYYNVHGLSFGTSYNYMYGGWDHCGYNFNTMGGVIKDLPTSSGSHWGPAHEIGHQHQGLLNMRGLTEVTNNLFSNVVLWYFGETTSRYNGTEGALSNVLAQFNAEGTDFFSNNIWAQTIMYYKLFLYYHVLGYNPKFYPRLFEMLRQDPMTIEYNQDGSECLMHFYKKCCEAAGEDLTEFFRAHGFFEVMSNRLVGDYNNAVYNLTQRQIDAAIAEVKAKKYPENISVLFITDATSDEIQSHKEKPLALYGSVCGELGSYSTFNNNTEASYTYNISGTTVTMEGTGGVGFAILNDKGELIGFSDKKTFEISAEAAEAIVSGKASIVTINADNSTPVVATNIMDSGDDDTRHKILGNLLGDAKAALDCSDDSSKKVGFYRVSALTELQAAYNTAKSVYDEKTASAYSAVYDVLYQELIHVMNSEYARIKLTDGYVYRLKNKHYPARTMGVNAESVMYGLESFDKADADLWYIEAAEEQNRYYLKNKLTGKYAGDVQSGMKAEQELADAYAYQLCEKGTGVYAFVGSNGLHCSTSNEQHKIVGWTADADASQWYITAIELDDALEERTKLEETIYKTTALINEMADALPIQNFKLQTEDQTAAFYLSTNACYNTLSGKTDGQGLTGLLDESTETYFHSDYSGNAEGTHYLQVDLGVNHNIVHFKFNYATRANGNNCPTAILVEGSHDGEKFNTLKTFTATNDGLPNPNTEEAASWESPVIIDNSNKYRLLRFSVTATENSQKYFVMSTFGITNPTPIVNAIKDDFVGDDASNEELKAQIVNALTKLAEAQQLVEGEKVAEVVYSQQNAGLNEYYTALLEVYNTAKNKDFNAKKDELQKLIGQANTLITDCGTVTFTPGTYNGEAPLQVSDADGDFYVWTNAQSKQEGPISGLIDGNSTGTASGTYFHTDYSGANSSDGRDHYINVNLGIQTSDFEFTYINRPDTDGNYAAEMTVLGSTDGEQYEEIAKLKELPADQRTTYTERITTTKEYSYLRFMVTKNSSNATKGGHAFFHMAEFSLTIHGRDDSYTVELNNYTGEVTTDLLIATFKETAEAQSTLTHATTEQQVVKAIAQLQAQYDALAEAKNNQYAQELQAKIDETKALIAECGRVEGEIVEVLETAGDATKQQILDTYNQVATAQALVDAGGATQSQYEEATSALEEKRAALATAKAGNVKSTLRTLTGEVATLISLCGTTPGDVSEVMLNALTTANQEALDLLQGDNLTAIAEKTTALQEQYTTVATAQQATGKSTLSRLIADMATLISQCTTGEGETLAYVGDVTETLLSSSIQAKEAAQAVVDANDKTTADFIAATETLQGYYNTLNAAKNSTAKADLREKISELADLIEKCRITVTNTATRTEECDLQTTESGNSFYLSTTAGTAEGEIANLLDGDPETYFQTARSGAEEQYLLVDAGEGHSFKKFRFSYRTNKSPFPYTIKVYGSNDNSDFTELETINNLPIGADQSWTSSDISNETPYRYLRFNITKSVVALKVDDDELDTSSGGQLSNKFKSSTFSETPASEYCFVMSEFKITNIVDEEQETEILAGSVTEQQLNDATDANEEAETLADESAIQKDLIDKTEALQKIYNALHAAAFNVNLVTTDAERDKLLHDIGDGMTIATFSAPYATVIPDGVTAYYATQQYTGGGISLIPITKPAIPACQGVIIIGKPGLEIATFEPATDEEVADLSGNKFLHSALGSAEMGANDYILSKTNAQGIGIYKAKQGTFLKAGKAFLRNETLGVKSLVLKFNGNTTDIDFTETDVDNADEPIFDIYGRRVTKVIKGGIYIKNGKKFIAK